MPLRVESEGSLWVEPAAPIKAEWIKLSACENLCAQVYPTGLWFFPYADDLDPMIPYRHLARGMARMLYQQPILAGTLRHDERGAFLVEIPESPGAGCRFHYRDVSNDPSFPTLQYLADNNFPCMDGETDGLTKLHPEIFPCSSAGDPVLLGQMTRLKGGVSLMMCITHMIGDLVQPRLTICSWAAQTETVGEAEMAGEPEPPMPFQFPPELLDRSLLRPPVPGVATNEEVKKIVEELGDLIVMDPEDPSATVELLKQVISPAHLLKAEAESDEVDHLQTHIGGMWHFNMAKLKELQKAGQEQSKERVSTLDALFAFLWQRYYVAKYALGKHAKEGEPGANLPPKASIIFPGDIRTRMHPPLPQAYIGAAIDVFRTDLSKEILVPDGKDPKAFGRSLAAVANAVRETNRNWDEERFVRRLKLAQQTPINVPFLPKGPIDLLITDHTRNEDADHCNWGPHLGVTMDMREPYINREVPAGEITIMPRKKNGDFHIMITGERITLQRLARDEYMQHFTTIMFIQHNVAEAAMKQAKTGSAPSSSRPRL